MAEAGQQSCYWNFSTGELFLIDCGFLVGGLGTVVPSAHFESLADSDQLVDYLRTVFPGRLYWGPGERVKRSG